MKKDRIISDSDSCRVISGSPSGERYPEYSEQNGETIVLF